MSEFLALAKELSSVGFPTLLVAIIYASYKGWWVWGSAFMKREIDLLAQLAKAERSAEEWKQMTFSATGLAEGGMIIAKRRGDTNVPQ